MKLDQLHTRLVGRCDELAEWFSAKSRELPFPLYSSFDMRDADFKVAPVDANIFPAGFNNICEVDREAAVDLAGRFLDAHYGSSLKRIVLLSEEHTGNPYYWDNVIELCKILQGAGREIKVAIPSALPRPLEIKAASGRTIVVHSAVRQDSGIVIGDFKPDLLVSNNDFSVNYEEWARGLSTPMNPPRELGWYRRRKHRFFAVYNKLAEEFANLIGLDPWLLQIETVLHSHLDVDDESSRKGLAEAVAGVMDRLRTKYAEHGIKREPFVFVKNNAGTYGLGVVQVSRPDEVLAWNNKTRKKMKAAKGGREVNEVVIQEGIPTSIKDEEGRAAEPVIYMIGCQLAGGFLRAHSEKSDVDSLNSPGAVFKRLCVSDMRIKLADCPMENTYGWLAKLGFLSVALEARELKIEFPGYKIK